MVYKPKKYMIKYCPFMSDNFDLLGKQGNEMFENIEWIFFDVGSTLVDESFVYEHIFRDIAELTHLDYQYIYDEALKFYKQNKKGDRELGMKYNLPKRKWYLEDEILYENVLQCLEILCDRYHIGIIANQTLGTKSRLEKWGILPYIDLVIASAEEGVKKPNPKIFEIALSRAKCKANKAVMIGDRIDNDIVPAKRLGIHTIWLKQGFGGYWSITGEDEKPDCIVNSIMELCEYL